MRPYARNLRALPPRTLLLFFVVILGVNWSWAGTPNGITKLRFRPDDPDTREGFQHFYNLEYDQAIHCFELAAKSHPNDAFALNHLLSGVMFRSSR